MRRKKGLVRSERRGLKKENEMDFKKGKKGIAGRIRREL